MEPLDKIDRQLLRMLQADGRATYDQLAEQVSLSPSTVLRRVKRLEESGVIDRYVALVKPISLYTTRGTIPSKKKLKENDGLGSD